MKDKKELISLLDFVNKEAETEKQSFIKYVNILNYAKFLGREFSVNMLLPADEKGEPYEEPKSCCSGRDCGCMGMPYNYSSREELTAYENSLSKVLFPGFKFEAYDPTDDQFIIHYEGDNNFLLFFDTSKQMFSDAMGEDIFIGTIEGLQRYLNAYVTAPVYFDSENLKVGQ